MPITEPQEPEDWSFLNVLNQQQRVSRLGYPPGIGLSIVWGGGNALFYNGAITFNKSYKGSNFKPGDLIALNPKLLK